MDTPASTLNTLLRLHFYKRNAKCRQPSKTSAVIASPKLQTPKIIYIIEN